MGDVGINGDLTYSIYLKGDYRPEEHERFVGQGC